MSQVELPSYDRVKRFVTHLGQGGAKITIVAIANYFKITNVQAAKFVTQLEEDGTISRWNQTNGRQLLKQEE